MRAYGLTPLSGEVGFALRSGRQPVTATEVVVGPDTADRLGLQLGDTVVVAPQSESTDQAQMTVVGVALFPDDGDGGFTDAVGYFGEGFEQTRSLQTSSRRSSSSCGSPPATTSTSCS